MMQYAVGTKNPKFFQPSGITKATVCTDVGILTDVFLTGHVPRECKKAAVTKKKETSNSNSGSAKEKCSVVGKENLAANDPNCAVDMCSFEGLENLASNDPNCIDATLTDSDNDGVMNDVDKCPDTASGATVDALGCSEDQTPLDQP